MGDLDEVQRLYEIDPDRIHIPDVRGKTALHHAGNAGHIHVIEFLLSKGAGKKLSYRIIVHSQKK